MLLTAGFFLALIAETASAQGPSVLRTARGLASDNVAVLVNRAIVVESAQPFVEVSVAQPEIADVSSLSDRAIYIFGRSRGTTTLTLLGENGALIANVDIRVAPDLGELKKRLQDTMPGEKIDVRPAGAGIVLSGTVSGKLKMDRALTLARAYAGDAVTNLMSIGGTQQVSLKVRIAEMSRSAAKDIGISTGAVGVTNRTSTLIETGDGVEVNPNPDDDGAIFTQLLSGFGTFGAVFQIADSFLVNLTIDALESKGFARTLSEPNLVALSGSEAEFLAGGEVPIPIISDDGADVQFKPIGVALTFLPTVLDDGLINIALATEVSSIDSTISSFISGLGGITTSVPGFTVRRAATVIELRDGESFAIAGLYEEDFTDAVSQLPWVSDLPVIGNLFRSVDFQRGESELVILVTANLVTPVSSEDQLVLPTDRVALPTEAELFLFGRTEGAAAGAPGAGQGFDGSYGYVVE
ncbi:MAG: type II and III secretion system protein family protein [Pseudomonadota bacterium]